MIITTDDLCLEYLDNFRLFDDIKREYPNFRLITFAISNYKNKENLKIDIKFKKWFKEHCDWVEIAVHSYDHDGIPDGDRENEGFWIEKAYRELEEYLPKEYGYRSPGWQTTNKTEGILKKLGFSYIAYETKIKYLNTNLIKDNVVNSHLYDIESIKRIYEILKDKY